MKYGRQPIVARRRRACGRARSSQASSDSFSEHNSPMCPPAGRAVSADSPPAPERKIGESLGGSARTPPTGRLQATGVEIGVVFLSSPPPEYLCPDMKDAHR